MESRRLWKDPHARLLVKPKSITNIVPSLILLNLTSLVLEFSRVTLLGISVLEKGDFDKHLRQLLVVTLIQIHRLQRKSLLETFL